MATRSNRRRRHPSGDEDLPKRLREDGNGEGSSSGKFTFTLLLKALMTCIHVCLYLNNSGVK